MALNKDFKVKNSLCVSESLNVAQSASFNDLKITSTGGVSATGLSALVTNNGFVSAGRDLGDIFALCAGNITGVTAGSQLGGGGTNGNVTLNLNLSASGAGIGSYGSTNNGTKIDTITLDEFGRVTAVACGDTGTVTSVGTGDGLAGGAITGSGTLTVDSSVARRNALNNFTGGLSAVGLSALATNKGFVSAGKDLNELFTSCVGDITEVVAGTGLTGGGASGSVTLNVSAGDGVQATANCVSVNSTVVRTTGGQSIGGAKCFSGETCFCNDTLTTGNATIQGNLSVTGDFTRMDTIVSTTSALSIINHGTGPALFARQSGSSQPIAEFVDKEGGQIIFDDGGLVGLGTSAPGQRLTVAGNVSAHGNLSATGTGYNYFNSRVGIGATAPGSILEVQGDGGNNKQLRLASGSSAVYWDIGRNFNSGHFEITEDSGSTYFLIDKDNGNIGIGTTAPAEKLTVAGNISAQGGLSAHSAFLSGSVNLPDDAKIQLGNGNDLEIYHDGSESYIEDTGTGRLFIRSDGSGVFLQKTDGSDLAKFKTDGNNELYYNNSKKFETTAAGAKVIGGLSAVGLSALAANSGFVSAGKDLNELFTSCVGDITEVVAGAGLTGGGASGSVTLNVSAGDGVQATANCVSVDSTVARCNAANTFVSNISVIGGLSASNACIAGSVNLPDDGKLILGDSTDLQIYHDGSNSYIQENGTGSLCIRGADVEITTAGGNKYFCGGSNVASLYHTNNKKLFTKGTGVNIIGELSANGTVTAETVSVSSTTNGFISAGRDLADIFGGCVTGSGTTCYIAQWHGSDTINNAPGYFNSEELRIKSLSAAAGLCTAGIRSVGNNLTVAGSISAIEGLSASNACIAGNIDLPDAQIRIGVGDDLVIQHDGANSYITEQGTGDLYIQPNSSGLYVRDATSGNVMIAAKAGSGQIAELYAGGDVILRTAGTGINIVQGGATVSAGVTALGLSAAAANSGFVSAGRDLSDVFTTCVGDVTEVVAGTGLTGGGSSGSVTVNVSAGDGVQATANCVSVDSTVVRTTGAQSIAGAKCFSSETCFCNDTITTGNATIQGNLSVTGEFTRMDTIVDITSAMEIQNRGTGPALTVNQAGSNTVLDFQDDGTSVLKIKDGGQSVFAKGISAIGGLSAVGGPVNFGEDDIGIDVKFNGDDTGRYALWDASSNAFLLADHAQLRVGCGSDLRLYHTGDSYIRNYTGSLNIENEASGQDISIKADNGYGTATADYIRLDSSEETVLLGTGLPASAGYVGIGTTSPLNKLHLETSDSIVARFKSTTNKAAIVIQDDDTVGYFSAESDRVSMGFNSGLHADNINVYKSGSNYHVGIGTVSPSQKLEVDGAIKSSQYLYLGSDVSLYRDGGNILRTDDAFHANGGISVGGVSGGGYIYNRSETDSYIKFDDPDIVMMGGDVGIGTTAPSEKLTVAGNISAQGGLSAHSAFLSGSVNLPDTAKLQVGNSNDLEIYNDTSASLIDNNVSHLYLRQKAADQDIVFQADNGSGTATTYFKLDGNAVNTCVCKSFRFADNVCANFGTDSDLRLKHDGSNVYFQNTLGDFYISNHGSNPNRDITFFNDDGYGNCVEYLKLDGGAEQILISNGLPASAGEVGIGTAAPTEKLTVAGNISATGYLSAGLGINVPDSNKITLGDAHDLELWHNGSVSYVRDVGTGGLHLQTNGPAIYLQDTDGNAMAQFTDNGNSFLYSNHVLKFNTTNTGACVYGGVSAASLSAAGANHGFVSAGRDLADIFETCSSSVDGSGTAHKIPVWSDADTLGDSPISANGTNVRLADNSELQIGTGGDFRAKHNATDTYFQNYTGHLFLINSSDDKDIFLQSDDGYGNIVNYIVADGGTEQILLGTGLPASAGEVGIGTTAPTEKLTVAGNISAHGSLSATGAGYNYFNSRVGIGTYSPGAKLDIKGDGADIFLCSNDFKIARIQPRGTGANLDKGLFSLMDGSVEDVRIDTEGSSWFNGGNVGIGTTGPAQKLHLEFANTDTSFSGGGGGDWGSEGLLIENTSSNTSTMAMIQLRTGDADIHIAGIRQGIDDNDLGLFFEASEKVRFTHDGNVGIGTTAPGQKLTVAGNISAHGALSATGAGDNYFAGNVGIGTADPPQELSVKGEVTVMNTSNIQVVTMQRASDHGQLLINQSGGVNRVCLNSSGDSYFNGGGVGIGTTSLCSEAKLTVCGDTSITGNLSVLGDFTRMDTIIDVTSAVEIQNHGTGPALTVNQAGNNTVVDFQDDGASVFKIINGGQSYFGRGISAMNGLSAQGGTAPIVFGQNDHGIDVKWFGDTAGCYMQWDASQNRLEMPDGVKLVLGDGADSSIQHVSDQLILENATGDLIIRNKADNGDVKIQNDDGYGGCVNYVILDGGTEQILLGTGLPASAGEVGIGTTAPAEKLHVIATAGEQARFGYDTGRYVNVGYQGIVGTYGSNNNNLTIGTVTAGSDGGHIRFKAINTEYARLTRDGKFGIGTTAPAEKLTVAGNISANGSLSATGSDPNYFAGCVGIGTLSPTEKLTIAGNLTATGDIRSSCGTVEGKILYARNCVATSLMTSQYISNIGESCIQSGKDGCVRIGTSCGWAMTLSANCDGVARVGIGGTIPGNEALTVAGNISAHGGLSATGARSYFACNVGITIQANDNALSLPDSAILALGTSSDLQLFHSAPHSYITNTQNEGNLIIQNCGNNHDLILKTDDGYGGTAAYLQLDGGNQEVYISTGLPASAGNVGIGTTSPNDKLTVAGSISAQVGVCAGGFLYATCGRFSSNVCIGGNCILFPNDAASAYIRGADTLYLESDYDNDDTGGKPIIFQTAASEKMRIHGDGNVGIGVTTPGQKLTISGNISAHGSLSATGAGYNYFNSRVGIGTTSPSGNLTIESSSNVIADINTTTGNANTTIRLRENGSNKATIGYDGTNDGLILTTGGFTAGNGIFINDSQNVGIGTTAPTEKLSIAGNISAGGDICVYDDLIVGTGGGGSITVCGAEAKIQLCDTTDTDDMFMTFDNGGTSYACLGYLGNADFDICTNNRDIGLLPGTANVGIGETAPAEKLTVAGNISAGGDILTDSVSATKQDPNYFAGKVGIGTTGPQKTLHLYCSNTTQGATLRIDNPSTTNNSCAGIEFVNSSTGTPRSAIMSQRVNSAYDAELVFYTSPDDTLRERLRIDHDGNVGISTSAPGQKLTVAGNISAQGGLSAHSAFLSGSVNLPDDAKIQLGNGNDLEIYHDGLHSYIDDTGTGDLILRANDQLKIQGYSNSHNMAVLNKAGSVDLYYNNSKKFETSTDGITIYGGATALGLSAASANHGFVSAGRDLADVFATSSGNIDGSGTTCYIANFSDSNTIQASPGYFNSQELRIVSLSASAGICTAGIRAIGNNLTVGGSISATNGLSAQGGSGPVVFGQDDHGVDVTFYGDTADRFANWDASDNRFELEDNVAINLGTGGDLQLIHDSADSCIINNNRCLYIIANDTDSDIKFMADNGSGVETEYFRVDGGYGGICYFKGTLHADGVQASYGTGNDMQVFHNGADGFINNNAGELRITGNEQVTVVGNISAHGSLSATGAGYNYFASRVGIGTTAPGNALNLADNCKLSLGTGDDLLILHNGTNSYIQNETGDFRIEQRANDGDMEFYSDNGSGGIAKYFHLDGGEALTIFSCDTRHNDNVIARWGGGNDLNIYHDGSSSIIQNATGHLDIKNDANDADVRFFSDDGANGTTEYFRLDGGLACSVASKSIRFGDNVLARFGNDNDTALYHTGSDAIFENNTGDFYIKNHADDKDIIFQSDDGSGGVETYFFLDGSSSSGNPYTTFPDNSRLTFGDGRDLQIMHNGTNTVVENLAGNLTFTNYADDNDIIFQSDDGAGGVTDYLRLDGGESIMKAHKKLRFLDNVKGTFGNGDDLQIYHDGTHSYIANGAGELRIDGNDLVSITGGVSSQGYCSDNTANTCIGSDALEDLTTGCCNTAVGHCAAHSLTTGADNVAMGHLSLTQNLTGDDNIAIGYSAGCKNKTSQNIMIGYEAGRFTTGGCCNNMIGWRAGWCNVSGVNNTFIGNCAGCGNTAGGHNIAIGTFTKAGGGATHGDSNVIIGDSAGTCLNTANSVLLGTQAGRYLSGGRGNDMLNVAVGTCTLRGAVTDQSGSGGGCNIAIGHKAMMSNTIGIHNTAVGCGAMTTNTTGCCNVSLGRNNMLYNTTGDQNTSVGTGALQANTTGDENVAVGARSLIGNTIGCSNVAIGNCSLTNNITGTDLIAIGYQALCKNNCSSQETAIGYQALKVSLTARDNTAVGFKAGCLIEGCANTAIGSCTLRQNTTGCYNTGVGRAVLYDNTTGYYNAVLGADAAANNTTGLGNAVVGGLALGANLTGNYNSVMGLNTLCNNTDGHCNVAIGYGAGRYQAGEGSNVTSADDSTYIGARTQASGASPTNETVIGFCACGCGDNTISIGSGDSTVAYFGGCIWLKDNQKALYGTGADLAIYHNGNTSYLENSTCHLVINQVANDRDVCILGSSIHGNQKEYVHIDSSQGMLLLTTGVAASAGKVGIGQTSPQQKLDVEGVIKQKVYTVAALPSASSSTIGARAFVSDSYYPFNKDYLGTQISGSGSNFSPVFSDGSNWIMG